MPENACGSGKLAGDRWRLERLTVNYRTRLIMAAAGLEFDSVLIADPAAILAASPRGRNDLYVAMTRST